MSEGNGSQMGDPSGKSRRRFRAPLKVVLPTVAALGAGTAIAVAQIPGSDGKITGCYVTNTLSDPNEGLPLGTLRVIDPTDTTNTDPNAFSCANGEATITWNQQGPAGPAGPAGSAGQAGATGAQGPTGPSGPQGSTQALNVQSGRGVDVYMAINAGTDLAGLTHGTGGETQSITRALGGDRDFHLVQLSSFSLGAENPVSIGSSSGGAGVGKVKFTGFQVTKQIDTLSPALFLNVASGAHYKTLSIIVYHHGAGATSVPAFVYEMKLVFLTAIQVAGSSGPPVETIHGDAGTLALVAYKQSTDGKVSVGGIDGWNRVTNTQVTSIEP
jgi:type VI secretion system secreted protein Hcp